MHSRAPNAQEKPTCPSPALPLPVPPLLPALMPVALPTPGSLAANLAAPAVADVSQALARKLR